MSALPVMDIARAAPNTTRRPKTQGHGHRDDFGTPGSALDPLVSFLPVESVVWECACGNGLLVRALEARGFEVTGSDILDGRSYLHWEPDRWDVAVTNPPYSLKMEFLIRAYALGKPFAFLLPLTTLETGRRQSLFREHGLEVIFMPNRVNFETPNGRGSSAWFATAWFTHGLGIGREMTFWEPAASPSLFTEPRK